MQLINETSNARIDKYLSEVTDYSRTTINKMIDAFYITVNQKPTKNSYRLRPGDIIDIDKTYTEEESIEPVAMPINIVYEDEDLLIVDKPSGLVVHPGSGNWNNTLVNGLMHYTKNLSDVNGSIRPGIVHRIDKDTSGLLLVAKNNQTHTRLEKYFQNKEIKRKYIALLNGILPHTSATIDAPIGRDKTNRQAMTVTQTNSKPAITHLTVLKRYKNHTLVSCELETGRTHQIRVHTKYIGHPVHNDPVYSNKSVGDFGQFLHSSEMSFLHPTTQKPLHFTSPLPKEFQAKLNELEKDL